MSSKEPPKEVIYIFKQSNRDGMVVKIGKCTKKGKVADRMSKLKESSPVPLELLHTRECEPGTSKDIEAYVHSKLHAYRLRQAGSDYFEMPTRHNQVVIDDVGVLVDTAKTLIQPSLKLDKLDDTHWDATKTESADTEVKHIIESLREAKAKLTIAQFDIKACESKLRQAFINKGAGKFILNAWDKVSLSRVCSTVFDEERLLKENPQAAAPYIKKVEVLDRDMLKREAPALFDQYTTERVSKRLNVGK